MGVIHRWGCQVPNGQFSPEDVVSVYGDGFYVLMQGELGYLPKLRELAPNALFLLRGYLQDWVATNPADWARHLAVIYRQNKHLTRLLTWANEQNLAAESNGKIGATPTRAATRADYEAILAWNLAFLDAWDREPGTEDALMVFPGLAYGHSDDQDDGAGCIGLEVLAPVIERCEFGNIHLYVKQGKPVEDEWEGIGRYERQTKWFQGKPILVGETGHFEAYAEHSPGKLVDIGYLLQGKPDCFGFAFFIHADPTRAHQDNDMSRNPQNYEAIRNATKTERGRFEDWKPVDQPDNPEPPPVPPDNENGLVVGYQVWQWNGVSTVANYQHLERDLNQIGARILTDKYMDSDAFMGRFDNDPMAVRDIQTMKDRKSWCEDRGIEYWPWDVPRAIPVAGSALNGAIHEAEVHADVCNQVGLKKRISDLEFYPSFFGYALHRPGTDVVSFFDSHRQRMDAAYAYYSRFRELSDTLTVLQPDIRQLIPAVAAGGIDAMSLARDGLIAELLGQTYAYWFMTVGDPRTHEAIVSEHIQISQRYGIPWGMCLYCEIGTPRDTPPDLAEQLGRMAIAAGARYLVAYKAPISPGLHPYLENVSRTITVPDAPKPPPQDTEEADLYADIWDLAEELEKTAKLARSKGYGWAGNGLDGAALAAKAAGKLLFGERDS